VLPNSQLVVSTSYKTWGWTILIWGVIMVLAGAGLFSGKSWSRWFGIFAVVINLIGQFAFFPAFPLWSLVVIGIDLAVPYALTVRWQEARADLRS
jgi:uncharacterized membrane protein (DUF2068 family)